MPLLTKARIDMLFSLSAVFMFFCAVAYAGQPFYARINSDNINLRCDSRASAEVIRALDKHDKVEVLCESYDWYKVRLPKDSPAYIRQDLLECIKYEKEDAQQGVLKPRPAPACISAKVLKDKVNIRARPQEGSWIIGKVGKNEILNVVRSAGGWCQVEPPYESYGWVHKKFVDKITRDEELPAGRGSQPVVRDTGSQGTEKIEKTEVVQGVIHPYGVVLWRKATHKLITDTGKVYLLKGNKRLLNSLCYRKVRVSAKIMPCAGGRDPLLEVSVIEELN